VFTAICFATAAVLGCTAGHPLTGAVALCLAARFYATAARQRDGDDLEDLAP
jgi:hypothetical protein